MRKVSNVIVGLIAAGVCVLITWLTWDSSFANKVYNLCFLAVMIIIMLGGLFIGFYRLVQTRTGLDRATMKMRQISQSGGTMSSITSQGATLFGIPYLDAKYQEYLTFLHKTNSPTDIGDYIGEYEINNYTHRRLIEMVPDILTSLGILGTFMGLVLGLRGFNPASYEAMSSSVESLIDGIKVAFVTSIYGLSLSLAFSYWLRGTLTSVSESLDRFLDAYYTSVVPPTDATAMNHIIANQNSQTRLMQQMQKDLAKEVAQSLSTSIAPMVAHLDKTMDEFTDAVTMNQEKLLENIGERVARTMKQEFFAEFIEMRKVMGEANQAQREHLQFMENAEQQFQKDVMEGESRMALAMDASSDVVLRALSAMNEQEQNLSTFVSDMRKAMDGIVETSDLNVKMTQQMEHLINMNDDVADKMMELAQLSERYTKSLASVQANNSELSEGLAVMNDSNIRMTDQISKMNSVTVEALGESQRVQKEYLAASSEYLEQIHTAQSELTGQMKTQQENLREFTEYMTQVLSRMTRLTEANSQAVTNLQARADRISQAEAGSGDMLTQQQLDRMIELLEAQEKRSARQEAAAYAGGEAPKRRGFFSRG
ncbi:MAG: MotA/TolQ/ExbB proton channel family protein [Lachnospiraceae bacterium]|nr:MotA/TolQ/ExbB proton channel family protein [Lachnospiraceae bacterium]